MDLPKVYLETTIPSYLTARGSRDLKRAADQQATEDWWNLHRPHYQCFISQTVIEEVQRGDPVFAKMRLEKLRGVALLEELPIAQELGVRLLRDQIIPKVASSDASHVAIAAAHAVDFFLTWNCKHIHNPHLFRRIERACAEFGLQCPVICSPAELVIP